MGQARPCRAWTCSAWSGGVSLPSSLPVSQRRRRSRSAGTLATHDRFANGHCIVADAWVSGPIVSMPRSRPLAGSVAMHRPRRPRQSRTSRGNCTVERCADTGRTAQLRGFGPGQARFPGTLPAPACMILHYLPRFLPISPHGCTYDPHRLKTTWPTCQGQKCRRPSDSVMHRGRDMPVDGCHAQR